MSSLIALLALSAHATAVPQVGTTVVLLGAASDPSFNKDVVDHLMVASRGVGMPDIDNVTAEADGYHLRRIGPQIKRGAYEIARVDMYDVSATGSVPSSNELLDYDVVLVYNDVPFSDPVAVGDLVATLVEDGAGLILAGKSIDSTDGLQGRFKLQNMSPVEYGTSTTGTNLSIDAIDDAYEWLVGPTLGNIDDYAVITVDGGPMSYHVKDLVPKAQAVTTHRWSDFEPAVVLLESALSGQGNVAVVNAMPPSSAVDPNGWDDKTQMAKLIDQTILWTQGFTRPIGQCWELTPFGWAPQLIQPFTPLITLGYVQFGDLGTIPLCRTIDDCNPNPAGLDCVMSQNTQVFQDLNCNGIDVFDEPTFDPNIDGQCLANLDPETGLPYDNNDYYHDFYRFTCDYVTDTFDQDFDQLSQGSITIFEIENPSQVSESVNLSCDNCPDYYNPNQYDWDLDGVGDDCDVCPFVSDPLPFGQSDQDSDGIGDVCDNCYEVPNTDQWDADDDGNGDACDTCVDIFNPSVGLPLGLVGQRSGQPDWDFDGVGDVCDNCWADRNYDGALDDINPGVLHGYDDDPLNLDASNPDQADNDNDRWGNGCDNCPDAYNYDQVDTDVDGVGDACDNCPGFNSNDITDQDLDGVGDACDNCDQVVNSDQLDADFDGLGDACDNCAKVSNTYKDAEGNLLDQLDADGDLFGDECDVCSTVFDPDQADGDGDEVGDACDNCLDTKNDDQSDRDQDGIGDDCDLCIFEPSENADNSDSDGDGKGNICDNCPFYPNFDQADDDQDGQGNACDVYGLRGGGEINPVKATGNTGCQTAPGGATVVGLGLVALSLASRRRSRKG